MAHLPFPAHLPGILGPLMFRPETAEPLNQLAEVLLVSDNSLTRGERELIASYVSNRNECNFCQRSHSTFAAMQIDGGMATVDAVKADPATAPVSPKLRALLAIAAKVQVDGRTVSEADVAAARAEGATDVEIHDTVLIAAAFCMFNRYVDGLGTWAPESMEDYQEMGERTVEQGYLPLPPRGVTA
ncbi:MAG: peroxidase-related enzyme [Acidimicrobiales bacterium]|nr:peroxidase-related enzyme [Acidimicrobiales bacterium]